MTSSLRWMTTVAVLLLAGSVLAITPGAASAQEAPPGRRWWHELDGGQRWRS